MSKQRHWFLAVNNETIVHAGFSSETDANAFADRINKGDTTLHDWQRVVIVPVQEVVSKEGEQTDVHN